MKNSTAKKIVSHRVCKIEALEKRYALSGESFEFAQQQESFESESYRKESDRDAAIRMLKTRYPALEQELTQLESHRHGSNRVDLGHEEVDARDRRDSPSHGDVLLESRENRHRSSRDTHRYSQLRPTGTAEGELIEATPPGPSSETVSAPPESPSSDLRVSINLVPNAETPFSNARPSGNSDPTADVNTGAPSPPVIIGTPIATRAGSAPSVVDSIPSGFTISDIGPSSNKNSIVPIENSVVGTESFDIERDDLLEPSSAMLIASPAGSELSSITSSSLARRDALSEFLEEQEMAEFFRNSGLPIPSLPSSLKSEIQQGQQSLTQDLAELDELLDSLAMAHRSALQKAGQYRTASDHGAGRTLQESNTLESATSAGAMILLETTSIRAKQSGGDANTGLNPANVAQWSVGIGFYRALELTGDARILQQPNVDTSANDNETPSELPPESDAFEQTSVPAHRGLSAIACVLGIQYLRRRKRLSVAGTRPICRRWRVR